MFQMLRKNILTVCLPFLVLLLPSCSSNPVTGKRELSLITEKQEIEIGREQYLPMKQIQGGTYNKDLEITELVDRVGQKIAEVSHRPHLPYEFVILNNSVPNAWALPGGKIAINKGLLMELENEAELAAVLSHEIVHASARHGAQQMQKGMLLNVGMMVLTTTMRDQDFENLVLGGAELGHSLITAKHSQENELEADYYGIEYMVAAGYDPQAAVSLQEKLARLSKTNKNAWLTGLFGSHPPSEKRLAANRKKVNKYPPEGRIGWDVYRRTMVGMYESAEAYDHFDKGVQALADGDAKKALKLADRAIAIDLLEAQFHGLRGKALFALGDCRGAHKAFDQAIVLNDEFFDFFLQRALVYEKLGDTIAMREDLEASVDLLSTAAGHYYLGKLEMDEGMTKNAAKHFRLATESDSEYGRLAKEKLAQITLEDHPDKLVTVECDLTKKGFLKLTAQNNSPIAIQDVSVKVQVREINREEGEDLPSGRWKIQFPSKIKSKGSYTVLTPIGPFFHPSEMEKGVKVAVLTAEEAP